MSDLDDLLGDDEPPRRGHRQIVLENKDMDISNLKDGQLPPLEAFHRPVGVEFLARVLNKDTGRLPKMLGRCPIIGYVHHKGKLSPRYDFREALSYLIEPKVDIGTWLKSQNAATLPNHINKTYWEAQAAKQRVLRQARDLWHNDDVLDVLGRTAMAIKEETQLWVEALPGKADLTTEQYHTLQRLVTELQDSIHEKLVSMPSEFRTESYAATVEGELDDTGPEE